MDREFYSIDKRLKMMSLQQTPFFLTHWGRDKTITIFAGDSYEFIFVHESYCVHWHLSARSEWTKSQQWCTAIKAGLILGLRPVNERRRYFLTTSLIGWVQASTVWRQTSHYLNQWLFSLLVPISSICLDERDKMTAISQTTFQMHSLEWKYTNSD